MIRFKINYEFRKENSIMDLKIKTEKEEFHGRTCGIIKQENKFLIMRVNKTSYYHIPGGHIEIGEDSEQAVIREIKEEIGCDVQETSLFLIQENFWTRNAKKCHGIEFYYIIKLKQQLQMQNYEKIENDKGEEKLLEFKWVTAEELKNIDLRPINIRDMLINEEYLKGLSHIVKRG